MATNKKETEAAVLELENADGMGRNEPILTVEAGDEIESAEAREDALWHEIQNPTGHAKSSRAS